MYNKAFKGDVCGHTHSFFLDNFIRRIFQNPKKIVGEYIREGNTVMDLGCGPGYFSVDMARMVGPNGRVVAVDLQTEMLEKLQRKLKGTDLEKRILLHKCPQDRIGLDGDKKADFILAYYMVHETPDHGRFLREIRTLLKPNGRFLVVEPPFHVSKNQFQGIMADARKAGFQILSQPSGKGGRSMLLTA